MIKGRSKKKGDLRVLLEGILISNTRTHDFVLSTRHKMALRIDDEFLFELYLKRDFKYLSIEFEVNSRKSQIEISITGCNEEINEFLNKMPKCRYVKNKY